MIDDLFYLAVRVFLEWPSKVAEGVGRTARRIAGPRRNRWRS